MALFPLRRASRAFQHSKRRLPGRLGCRLFLETLEDRQLLSFFTVTNISDSGAGSLRQAILDANASPGVDTIAFNIDGGGAQIIHPTSPLPEITDPVIIDGTTQPGFAGTPLVVLTGPGSTGLTISGGNSTVKGLVINQFRTGILLQTTGGNVIEGNYIGTDVSGIRTPSNGQEQGISILGGMNNLIGGTAAGSGNLISGNYGNGLVIQGFSSGTRIQGNLIGTDVTGTKALGNGVGIVIAFTPNNLVGGATLGARNLIFGGATLGARNLISGNAGGIELTAGGSNVVQGNFIGTDITGTAALGNQTGVEIYSGSVNTERITGVSLRRWGE
jgi:hypothetical protein